jgi:hypothetical protein
MNILKNWIDTNNVRHFQEPLIRKNAFEYKNHLFTTSYRLALNVSMLPNVMTWLTCIAPTHSVCFRNSWWFLVAFFRACTTNQEIKHWISPSLARPSAYDRWSVGTSDACTTRKSPRPRSAKSGRAARTSGRISRAFTGQLNPLGCAALSRHGGDDGTSTVIGTSVHVRLSTTLCWIAGIANMNAFLRRVAYTRTDIGPAAMCVVQKCTKERSMFAVTTLPSFLASMPSPWIACLLTGHCGSIGALPRSCKCIWVAMDHGSSAGCRLSEGSAQQLLLQLSCMAHGSDLATDNAGFILHAQSEVSNLIRKWINNLSGLLLSFK